MKKLIIYPVIVIITITVIFFLYFTIIFDINDYKEDITKYISEKTKYEVTYDGRIEANYFPNTIISVPNINIYLPKTKKTLIKIDAISLTVLLEPLLNKILDVESLIAKNFKYFGVNVDATLLKTYSLIKLNNFYSNNVNFTEVETLSARTIIIRDTMQISNIFIETELLQANGSGTLNIATKELYIEMIGKIKSTQDLVNKYKSNYPEELIDEELPVIIAGPINSVTVSVNLNHILINKIEPIKEKIIDEIEEKEKIIDEIGDKVLDRIKDKIKLPF